MRKVLIVISLLLVAIPLGARIPKFSYGLEWGYTGTFLRTYQYNYIYSEGARIIENDAVLWYYSNGSVLANAGIDLGRNVNLSVYSGLLGVYSRRWMVPVELRTRWCPMGLEANGLVTHLGAALAFPTKPIQETCARVNIGAGYRVHVYKHISADFLMSFVLTTDHDSINDPDTGYYVPTKDITKNYAEYWGVGISAAINF